MLVHMGIVMLRQEREGLPKAIGKLEANWKTKIAVYAEALRFLLIRTKGARKNSPQPKVHNSVLWTRVSTYFWPHIVVYSCWDAPHQPTCWCRRLTDTKTPVKAPLCYWSVANQSVSLCSLPRWHVQRCLFTLLTLCPRCWHVYHCDLIELDSICFQRQSRKGKMARRDEQRLA